MRTQRRVAAAVAAASLVFAVPGQAQATWEFAPPDRPGAPLSAPAAALAASLTCTAGVDGASTTPVLLLPATGVNSTENFGWNYQRVLSRAGIPWCASNVPSPDAANHNMADTQTRGEYVTYAIRTMYQRAGRKISIVGHSQGGMIGRWSLRFWPDTRAMVDDLIGMAPSNHGTQGAVLLCALPCQPANSQQASGSQFHAALDSYQETFAGISYTTIRTDYDEVVLPSANSALSGPGDIANLRTQDRCPLNVAEHLTVGTTDPVAEAYVMDALRHSGPAQLSRISRSVCLKPYMSGVNPLTAADDAVRAITRVTRSFLEGPRVDPEPPLRCYTRAIGC